MEKNKENNGKCLKKMNNGNGDYKIDICTRG